MINRHTLKLCPKRHPMSSHTIGQLTAHYCTASGCNRWRIDSNAHDDPRRGRGIADLQAHATELADADTGRHIADLIRTRYRDPMRHHHLASLTGGGHGADRFVVDPAYGGSPSSSAEGFGDRRLP